MKYGSQQLCGSVDVRVQKGRAVCRDAAEAQETMEGRHTRAENSAVLPRHASRPTTTEIQPKTFRMPGGIPGTTARINTEACADSKDGELRGGSAPHAVKNGACTRVLGDQSERAHVQGCRTLPAVTCDALSRKTVCDSTQECAEACRQHRAQNGRQRSGATHLEIVLCVDLP